MGFLSGSSSFTRYHVSTTLKDDRPENIRNILKANSFREIEGTVEESSYGFVPFEDMFDLEWQEAFPFKADYLAFSLRLDTRRISPAVYKKYMRWALDEEKKILRDLGKTFISKERRKELAEQVRLKLLSKTLPVPAVFDIVWNMRTGSILLSSTSSKIKGLFEDIFYKAFELVLEPAEPFFLAKRVLPESQYDNLEEVEPSLFARD